MSSTTLSMQQYSTVYNMLSFAVASMLGAFAFFVMGRKIVGKKYQLALVVSSLVVLIAGYHYWRIMGSWQAAYSLKDGMYVPTGEPFNDAYRYVDWLLTVPLLLTELVLVMKLKNETGGVLGKLILAAVAMIALGYPGEISNPQTESGARLMWAVLSTIPFCYILYVLWGRLGAAIADHPPKVQVLLNNTRYLILLTWGFYPIVYAMGSYGFLGGGGSIVAVQVGYSIADVTAKALYGVMIFAIAYAKSEADGSLAA
jgi:bacteriorhodopsin